MRLWSYVVAVLALAGCSRINASAEQIEAAEQQCVEMDRSGYVQAGKTWEREGKLVVELQERESQFSTTYRQRLCVVDFEGGTIELPSAFEQGRWRK